MAEHDTKPAETKPADADTKSAETKTADKPATSKLEDHPNWNPVTGEVAVLTREEADELATRGREVEPRGTVFVVKKKSA